MNGWRVKAATALATGLAAAACGDREIAPPVALPADAPVEYPVEQWDAGVEGVALVRALVNDQGGVDSVMIAEGSGSAELDSAALRGVRAMTFEPARREGEPVRVWARVPVHFSKADDAGAAGPGGDAR